MNDITYLSEDEKKKIGFFLEDELLVSSIKKVLLAGIYESGTLKPDEHDFGKNWVFSYFNFQQGKLTNEELGQRLRATVEAQSILENAFKELEQFKNIKVGETTKVNKAR